MGNGRVLACFHPMVSDNVRPEGPNCIDDVSRWILMAFRHRLALFVLSLAMAGNPFIKADKLIVQTMSRLFPRRCRYACLRRSSYGCERDGRNRM